MKDAYFSPKSDDTAIIQETQNRDLLPIVMQGHRPLTLPREIDSARTALSAAGYTIDPCRIDVYQLGAQLCRLTTGENVDSFVRSPRTKKSVPPYLQPVIVAALGNRANDRHETIEPLLEMIFELTAHLKTARID